eukprot:7380420-Prymnesium_polylepis.2
MRRRAAEFDSQAAHLLLHAVHLLRLALQPLQLLDLELRLEVEQRLAQLLALTHDRALPRDPLVFQVLLALIEARVPRIQPAGDVRLQVCDLPQADAPRRGDVLVEMRRDRVEALDAAMLLGGESRMQPEQRVFDALQPVLLLSVVVGRVWLQLLVEEAVEAVNDGVELIDRWLRGVTIGLAAAGDVLIGRGVLRV